MRLISVLGVLLCVAHLAQAQEKGEYALSAAPAFRWLTEADPYGSIYLTNDGTGASEITVDLLSLAESPLVEDSPRLTSLIGDLSPQITLFPPRMILEPGETRVVRYSVRDVHILPPGGHVALVRLRLAPRTPVSQFHTPPSTLSINYAMLVPLVLIKEIGTPEIEVRIESSAPDKLIVALENGGNSPWEGNINVESVDGLTLYGSAPVMLFGEKKVEIRITAPIYSPVRFVFDEDLPHLPDRILRTPSPITLTF